MKKNIFLLILATFVVFYSCKKDKDSDPYDVGYSDKSVTEVKNDVEDEGIELINMLEDLNDATAVEVLINMGDLMSSSSLKSTSKPTLGPLDIVRSIGTEDFSIEDIRDAMQMNALVDSTIGVSDLWDSIVGTYTYNFSTSDFDVTPNSDAVVVKFPGKATDLSNTAELTIDNFTYVEIASPAYELPPELKAELPTNLDIELKYNNVVICTYEFDASYTSDGIPTSVKSTLTIDNFSFVFEATHSPYTSASVKFSFKYNSDILLEWYLQADGNWTESNINTSEGPEDVINSANAHFIFMNIKVLGQVNFKNMADSMEIIFETMEPNEDGMTALANLINNNAKLIVIYRDSNTKIAEAEAYVESYYDEYYGWDYWISMRFVYADGSKVDVETYITEELDRFYTELNSFIALLNSEYGLGIDQIVVK